MNETRQRQIDWSISGNETTIIAWIDGKKYGIFFSNAEERKQAQECLGACAANPMMNMSWEDAAAINAKIRELAPRPVVVPLARGEMSDTALLFRMVLPGVVLWGVIAPVLWWLFG